MTAAIRFFKSVFGSVSSDRVIPDGALVDELTFELLTDEVTNEVLIEE